MLRKKQNQVSFLHVYHHTITALFSWCYLKWLPGEQGLIIGFLNSLVHVFMYTYYMIAAMGPKYRKYLWWKKYITKIQLVNFENNLMKSNVFHFINLNCWLIWFIIPVTIWTYPGLFRDDIGNGLQDAKSSDLLFRDERCHFHLLVQWLLPKSIQTQKSIDHLWQNVNI